MKKQIESRLENLEKKDQEKDTKITVQILWDGDPEPDHDDPNIIIVSAPYGCKGKNEHGNK